MIEIKKCPACKKRVKRKPTGYTFCDQCGTLVFEPEKKDFEENEENVEDAFAPISISDKPMSNKLSRSTSLPVKKREKKTTKSEDAIVPNFDPKDDAINMVEPENIEVDVNDPDVDIDAIDWEDDSINDIFSDDNEEHDYGNEEIQNSFPASYESSLDDFEESSPNEESEPYTEENVGSDSNESISEISSKPFHSRIGEEINITADDSRKSNKDEDSTTEFLEFLSSAKSNSEKKESKLTAKKTRPAFFDRLQDSIHPKEDMDKDEYDEDKPSPVGSTTLKINAAEINNDGYYDNTSPIMDADCESIRKDFILRTLFTIGFAIVVVLIMVNFL